MSHRMTHYVRLPCTLGRDRCRVETQKLSKVDCVQCVKLLQANGVDMRRVRQLAQDYSLLEEEEHQINEIARHIRATSLRQNNPLYNPTSAVYQEARARLRELESPEFFRRVKGLMHWDQADPTRTKTTRVILLSALQQLIETNPRMARALIERQAEKKPWKNPSYIEVGVVRQKRIGRQLEWGAVSKIKRALPSLLKEQEQAFADAAVWAARSGVVLPNDDGECSWVQDEQDYALDLKMGKITRR